MIRVTIELLPRGDESRKRTLGVLNIANDGTGTKQVGNYQGTLHAEYTAPNGQNGKVLNFNRQSQSVWSLVGAFLKMFGHTSHSPKNLENQ